MLDTVSGRGWSGIKNGELLGRTSGHYDVLVTMDQSIEFQPRISTLPFGIVLVHAPIQPHAASRPLVPSILSALDAVNPGRIRRVDSNNPHRGNFLSSRPTEDRAIVDVGPRLWLSPPPPLVCHEPAATYERASDEHRRLQHLGRDEPSPDRRQDPPRPRPLRPNRQPHDWYVAIRGNRVEQLARSRPRRGLSSSVALGTGIRSLGSSHAARSLRAFKR